jgi:hypothetical protein
MSNDQVPLIKLNDGNSIPVVAFGECETSVAEACRQPCHTSRLLRGSAPCLTARGSGSETHN